MIHLKIVRGDDGGTRSAGTLSLTDCELRDNHAGDGGGAIDGEGSSTVQLRFSSGVNLSISGTFEHTGRRTRTFDWQRASLLPAAAW